MAPPEMHADEVDIDPPPVGRRVAAHSPEWAELALEPLTPWGTDNALFRLGDDMIVRLPRRERSSRTLEKDPACDVMVAWKLFPGESRDLFRSTLSVDDATLGSGSRLGALPGADRARLLHAGDEPDARHRGAPVAGRGARQRRLARHAVPIVLLPHTQLIRFRRHPRRPAGSRR